jgi:hypothetical protein
LTNIFEVTDPLGWTVICTEDRFNNHIVSHHPGMLGCEDDIQQAIQSPDLGFVFQDAKRPERHIYYRANTNHTNYLKVVVEFDNGSGRVITAFRTSSVKSGEKLIWTPNWKT